jgi:hypothetical protein
MVDIVFDNPPDPTKIDNYVEATGATYPVVADVDGTAAEVFVTTPYTPVLYVIDREGVIVWTYAGNTGKTIDELRIQVAAVLTSQPDEETPCTN